jgi:hypothetical protein
MSKEKAIVTCGGTREPIDDVRYITNFSTGKFGYTIAKYLSEVGYDVTVLCPREVPLLAQYRIEDATHKDITTTETLENGLMEEKDANVVFHSAAVSDYKVRNVVSGKISSNEDSLIIECERTPKIISELRDHFGQKTFLVGFKLLSQSTRQELINASVRQNTKNHLNLTVANDLSDLTHGEHPVLLVTAEGGAIDLKGKKEDVAKNLVEFVKKRARVSWFHSKEVELPKMEASEKEKFQKLLDFAQDLNLLTDKSGNISLKREFGFLSTPRQVDKGKVKAEDAIAVVVDDDKSEVLYDGVQKPSIDSGVANKLYMEFPNIDSLVHFHNPWGKADFKTFFPYPCGAREEAKEIISQVSDRSLREFTLELSHHGFLMGLSKGSIERLNSQWEEVLKEFEKHLEEVNKKDALNSGILKPIFSGVDIVGVVRQEDLRGAVVYLTERARGKGVGAKIIEQLIERQMSIQTIDDCNVVEFYKKFGFAGERDEATGLYILFPPKITKSDELFDRIEEWKVK